MKTSHNFGNVTEKSNHNTTFKFDKKIVAATADCGCTVPLIQDKVLHVSISPGRVPKAMEEYNFDRGIELVFEDKTQLRVTVHAVVKRQ